ncbi:reducing polyketide synthase [Metarhizium rileyi]|uniref:Reducing polyketide synthase n=1 Tax=Metarhizium rileyi (strain RCEF 4871) TaxID=1649241 RepID=A0A162K1C3_METRR|nr:reducing polyketide synthase [Metarhizium rileyi RCEF 4871]
MELEISLDFPDEVGYHLLGLSNSKKDGFGEFSADITRFDRDMSQVILSVKDFHLAELEVGDGDGSETADSIDIDPAEISSEPKWNYALDLLTSPELKQVVDMTSAASHDKLIQLLSMVIHQRPIVDAIELVENTSKVAYIAVSRLPRGTLLLNKVSCDILNGDDDNQEHHDGTFFGRGLVVDSSKALPADVVPADLIVFSSGVANLEDMAEPSHAPWSSLRCRLRRRASCWVRAHLESNGMDTCLGFVLFVLGVPRSLWTTETKETSS